MKKNDINFRESTFLDFNPPDSIVEQIIGSSDEAIKNLFRTSVTSDGRAFTFIHYAKIIDDKKLLDIVNKEFEKDIVNFFNE